MKIQFFSDIHLEFGRLPLPATDADVVIAAGDIGVGLMGIEWLLMSGKPTIYVAGNHEFYNGDLVTTRRAIATATRGTPIHFLENSRVEIGGTRFLGATLWTDFMGGDEQCIAETCALMNDYFQIRNAGKRLRPDDLLATNAASRNWLEQEIDRPYAGRTVVVTHHAPTLASWLHPEQVFHRAAYCNDLTGILTSAEIDLWIHGHVHEAFDYQAHGVRVACNPRGYYGYQVVAGFDASRTLDL